MMNQTVFDTSEVLVRKGIKHVVLSPGSRNAPLTISFARNPNIKTYNVVDERSAGFIALGIAQNLKEPVVLCCTSGTSLLNYAPAIAEAFYQEIPLLVLSADRPPEWIGQRDGQTIDQVGALSNFVKATIQLPSSPSHPDEQWEYIRKLNDGVNLSTSGKPGPVHLNIPFKEPFYPASDQTLAFSNDLKIIEPVSTKVERSLTEQTKQSWHQANRKLIIVGQHHLDHDLDELLEAVGDQAVVIADVISNVQYQNAIRHHDLFLGGIDDRLAESLQPDLVLTIGKSVISKNLKLFLRKHKPAELWHVCTNGDQMDTYQALTGVIDCDSRSFLRSIVDKPQKADFDAQVGKNFIQNWQVENDATQRKMNKALKVLDWAEFTAFNFVLNKIPEGSDIHLANSMPVRFANFIQQIKPDCEVFCNRGTSGIDGTNGTAVGHALSTDRLTYLLTGDLSFFYDRNAFFHTYPMDNLKIVVFNNYGGGIFRLINGPANLPELEQHFETRHERTAKYTALEYGFDYHGVKDMKALEKAMTAVNKDVKSPKLLEIFTDPATNSDVFKAVKTASK